MTLQPLCRFGVQSILKNLQFYIGKYEMPDLDRLLKSNEWSENYGKKQESSKQDGNKLGHLKYHEMAYRVTLKIWETKVVNCEIVSQAIWPVAKFFSKRVGPKAQSEVHSPLSPIYYQIDKPA
jgi:hypothetical protein